MRMALAASSRHPRRNGRRRRLGTKGRRGADDSEGPPPRRMCQRRLGRSTVGRDTRSRSPRVRRTRRTKAPTRMTRSAPMKPSRQRPKQRRTTSWMTPQKPRETTRSGVKRGSVTIKESPGHREISARKSRSRDRHRADSQSVGSGFGPLATHRGSWAASGRPRAQLHAATWASRVRHSRNASSSPLAAPAPPTGPAGSV